MKAASGKERSPDWTGQSDTSSTEKPNPAKDGLANEERKFQTRQDESKLLSLPGEIRNIIYEYVFGKSEWVIGIGDQREFWGGDFVWTPKPNERTFRALKKHRHALALLQTCRQVYAEAYKLPWSLNTFKLNYDATHVWELPKGTQFINSIIINDWPIFDIHKRRARANVIALMRHFSGVKEIYYYNDFEWGRADYDDGWELIVMRAIGLVSVCHPSAYLKLFFILSSGKVSWENEELRKLHIHEYYKKLKGKKRNQWNLWLNGRILREKD